MASNQLNSGLDNVALALENNYVRQSTPLSPGFWYQPPIDGTRWNELYPYQLLVVTAEGKNGQVNYKRNPKWMFTLPITPEAIRVSTSFAITTEVTQGGIIEQHNGAPIKIIQLQGTLGTLPLKGSAEPLKAFNPAEAIFAGTIQGANNVTSAVQSALSNINGQSGIRPNIVKGNELSSSSNIVKTSGYYQRLLLRNFLESYAEYKKTEQGKNARLALAIWKDEAVYLVTPKSHDDNRQVPDVYGNKYQLKFEAFKRISLQRSEFNNGDYLPIVRKPNAFAALLKTIEDARLVLQRSKETLYAVVADIGAAIYEPLRQVTSFAKDFLGVALTTQDLPVNVIKQAKSAIIELISTQNTFNSFDQGAISKHKELVEQIKELQALGASLGKSQTLTGDLKASLTSALNSDAINSVFEHPENYPELFNAVKVGDLNLSPPLVKSIVDDQEKIRGLNRLDFEKMRDQFQNTATDFANAIGAGSPVYDRFHGKTPKKVDRIPKPSDFDVIFALNSIVLELNRLAASGEIDRFRIKPIEYIAGLANQSGIDFQVPISKRAVPFPFGMTLENLAYQYLGNPDRWMEIVALNGLMEPYIDETGFNLNLLTNGSGNDIVVSSSTNLYLNQGVTLRSNTVLPEKRYITSIKTVAKGQVIVTVDGASDLDKYKIVDAPYLHTFLPNTVNSQMLIYIPSQEATSFPDYQTKPLPSIKHFEDILAVGGVDLLLTSDNDLALTSDGDLKLSIGLNNLVQRARVALSIPRGKLPRHPTYGFGIEVGTNTTELDLPDIYKAVVSTFEDDPDFTGVKSVAINKKGPTLQLGINLEAAYLPQNIPITLDLTTP